MMAPVNPHSFEITWKRGTGPVTGHRVYCFPGDSQKADVVKSIQDPSQESAFISGLKPETVYRVGITSVCSGNESSVVFSKNELKLRKSTRFFHQIHVLHSFILQITLKIFCFQLEFIT